MLFNSLEFCIFFPTVVALAWILRRRPTLRLVMLLIASYGFYMCWSWRYLGLMLFSTVFDWAAALVIGQSRNTARRRLLLAASLVVNLGILGFFKYFNFFAASASDALGWFGISVHPVTHRFLLPVGISFYTFQSLSYTIDVYRGTLVPTRNLLKFATFVAFFPQLVAGPIVRAADFLPQLDTTPRFDETQAQRGLYLILVGLFKKVCIADVLAATLLDKVFGDPASAGSAQALLAAYGYTFQIYADFSGYSDVAIGAAAILGYAMPQNFDRPFLAISLRDFWRRWHITLSTWLRDYLYIPLGGSRLSARRTHINLAAVMLLGGLWHGAAWTFVAWGAIHGAGLVLERLCKWDRCDARTMSSGEVALRRLVTFHVVVAAFVMFRANSLHSAGLIFERILAGDAGSIAVPGLFYVAMALSLAIHFTPTGWPRQLMERFVEQPSYRQAAVLASALVLVTGLSLPHAPFIYFQF
jgi:D-alanyl-lipoteichoic acid acyltransferase DltB (MBOAT superfamily)